MRFFLPVGGIADSRFGIITAPNHKGIPAGIVAGMEWAGDLGCLQGPDYVKKIDFNKTILWLKKMERFRPKCLFIAGADIVGNAAQTLETYAEFSRYFDGWPLAYVAQNGAEDLPFPDGCVAVFIGGDTLWKCSQGAVDVIKRAQAQGLHIHIGRVNWGKRYRHFRLLAGSDSFTCDGTRTRFDGTGKAVKAWGEYQHQPPLLKL